MSDTSKMRCPECDGVTLAARIYDDGLTMTCTEAGCGYERGAGASA